MARRHEKYEQLLARCRDLPALPCAVAHPCDEGSLRGALEAAQLGLIQPLLVGPKARIAALLAELRLDADAAEIVDAPHSEAAAETAVALVRAGRAQALMKGSLHTDELMSAV